MKRIKIDRWLLRAREGQKLEYRFRRREDRHGPLVIVPQAQLEKLIERAETRSRQLALPFDLRGKDGKDA